MMKIKTGIIGATGMVGQQYISLLRDHPWFEVAYLAASKRSAGKTFREATAGRLIHDGAQYAFDMIIHDADEIPRDIPLVFSAPSMSKEPLRALEEKYAAAGIGVVSNAPANRWTQDVPMIIPEVNPDHADIIFAQRKNRGWDKGFIAVKPNCSIQSYMTPIWALISAGYGISRMTVVTMQAVSGAGYPGVPSLDMIDNIVPFINGEEEKSELEPLKILGSIADGKFNNALFPKISAHCNRVPVSDGHTACISLEFWEKKPGIDEIKNIWRSFPRLDLPSAPAHPIHVMDEPNRPQPKRDCETDKSMAVCVGRLRPCPVFDIRFVGLSHNTVRGAAGGGILNAELLCKKGFISDK